MAGERAPQEKGGVLRMPMRELWPRRRFPHSGRASPFPNPRLKLGLCQRAALLAAHGRRRGIYQEESMYSAAPPVASAHNDLRSPPKKLSLRTPAWVAPRSSGGGGGSSILGPEHHGSHTTVSRAQTTAMPPCIQGQPVSGLVELRASSPLPPTHLGSCLNRRSSRGRTTCYHDEPHRQPRPARPV